jgi:hypothetical protein
MAASLLRATSLLLQCGLLLLLLLLLLNLPLCDQQHGRKPAVRHLTAAALRPTAAAAAAA